MYPCNRTMNTALTIFNWKHAMVNHNIIFKFRGGPIQLYLGKFERDKTERQTNE